MIAMGRWLLCLALIGSLCSVFYLLGRSHAEVKIIKEQGKEVIKQVEVIKYVEREKAQIWNKPNAGRDDLLKLMQSGKL